MQRSGFERIGRAVRRIARQEASTPADRGRGSSGPATVGSAGGVDVDTGEVFTYGLVGVTTLAEGFRVRGTRYHYGRVGYTTLGEGFRVRG